MSNHDVILCNIDQNDPLGIKLAVIHQALEAVRQGSHGLTGKGLNAICRILEDASTSSRLLDSALADACELACLAPTVANDPRLHTLDPEQMAKHLVRRSSIGGFLKGKIEWARGKRLGTLRGFGMPNLPL